jgi:phospholipase C
MRTDFAHQGVTLPCIKQAPGAAAMPSPTCPIENIVVVMLENRSYDNVLGWLYGAGNAAPFDKAPAGQTGLNGLSPSDSNPDPSNPSGPPIAVFKAEPAILSGLRYPATTMPVNDPGEIFKDMAQQFTGSPVTSNPYGDWPPSDPSNLMQGFTENYLSVLDSDAAAGVPDVMSYLTPQQLPITGFLANQFAVADQWYASVPTQTFTNRVFSVCAAPAIYTEKLSKDSYSIIDDIQYGHAFEFDELLDLQSVFSALDTAMPNVSGAAARYWKLYYHDYSITAMTVPYTNFQ